MALRVARLAVAALVVLAACGSGGPTASELEKKHDIAGLVAMAVNGDEFSPETAAAVESLRRLNDPTTHDQLATALQTGKLATGEWTAESETIRVLGELGGPKSVKVILEWVRTASPTAQTSPTEVHTEIVVALATIGADAVEPLAAILETPETTTIGDNDDDLRSIAIDVFGGVGRGVPRVKGTGDLGAERAEQLLLTELKSGGDHSVQAGIALVARRADQPDVVLPLLDDPSTVAIYGGLIRLGLAGTEPALVAALERNADAKGAANMARAFINSGNQTLEEAGQAWAHARGYVIIPYCPSPPCTEAVTWGTLFNSD